MFGVGTIGIGRAGETYFFTDRERERYSGLEIDKKVHGVGPSIVSDVVHGKSKDCPDHEHLMSTTLS